MPLVAVQRTWFQAFRPDNYIVCPAAYMNQIKPIPVSKEVAARYPINIFLTYTKAGVRQHTLQSFPPACTPATLATMMQTGLNNLGDVSPYGVRLLVRF